ncbi:hypothetical protein [Fulvivirga lutimaris]|uniref:hypothetical protein n=1 Tax=Fulvivirga lutimaris TaxID=1819566 RepID=UPI0012BCE135|nr:hypothetical protein [Fulvivirga lutimaris]MTI38338.1 hypothetical protein [Fulvivirga lutimaris]
MKRFSKLYITLLLLITITISCQDEDLLEINNPTWETGVNSFGQFSDGSATNFIRGDKSTELDFDWRWISVDGANTIVSARFYVTWNESYVNVNGDAALANHGKELVYSTESLAGNREDISFTLTQDDLFAVFSGATYDYDDGVDGNTISVFSNPDKPTRNTSTQPFIDGDSFILTWSLTGADGRIFEAWSPSVCSDVPGSNCQLSWIVECGQVIADPSQTYSLAMADSYGDGWNGGALAVIVDGVSTEYTISSAQGSAAAYDVVVPDGATSVQFEYISGAWDSEVTFSVTTEKGNVIAKYGPSPPAGILTLDLCKENE